MSGGTSTSQPEKSSPNSNPEMSSSPESIRAGTLATIGQAQGILAQTQGNPEFHTAELNRYNAAAETSDATYSETLTSSINALTGLKSETQPLQSTPQMSVPVEEGGMSKDPELTKKENIQFLINMVKNGLKGIEKEQGIVDVISPTDDAFKFLDLFWQTEYFQAITDYFDKNPELTEKYVLNGLDLLNGCVSPESTEGANKLTLYLKEKYLENKLIKIEDNFTNFYSNQENIPEDKQDEFDKKLSGLQESEEFKELISQLKSGDCQIDNIAIISNFNESYFGEIGVEISFNPQDTQKILGSVIELKQAENNLEGQEAREKASETTGKTPALKEIEEALNSENPEEALLELYGLAEITPEIQKILDNNAKNIKLDQQAARIPVIAQNAQRIAGMSEEEREALKEAVMSSNYDSPEELAQIFKEELKEIEDNRENTTNNSTQESVISSSYKLLGTKENPILTDGIVKIDISPEEANMLENNPKSKENLINAHNYFSSIIGLPSIWKFRHDIVDAMNQIGASMKIDLSDDSLNTTELIKISEFINSTIYGSKGKKSEFHDTNGYELDLEIFANGGSEIVEKKSYSGLQQDRYEFLLRKHNILTEDNLGSGFITNLRNLAKSPDGLLGLEKSKK